MVEGYLGFGWEWDEPVAFLARRPATSFQVFHWSPFESLASLSKLLAADVDRLLATRPPSLKRLIVVGHSAGGFITAFAAARLHVPPGVAVRVVNVGTPYAGMGVAPTQASDFVGSPLAVAVGYRFTRYPTPAPGVTVESWMTSWPGDPVMKPRATGDPGDPRIGPEGPRHRLPPGSDHNRVLSAILQTTLKSLPE